VEAFIIKRGDTLPSLAATLTDENGPVDLTGKTVRFVMRPRKCPGVSQSVTPTVNRAAVVTIAVDGDVRYDWQEADTAAEGAYEAEFKVIDSINRVSTYPDRGFIPVVIGRAQQ
jgi:hypothetical protein